MDEQDEQQMEQIDNEEQQETQVVEIPAEQEIPSGYEEVPKTEEAEKPKFHSELDDLFETPQEEDSDIYTDDLFELDEQDIGVGKEDDMTDLFELSGDIGSPHHPKKKKIRRVGTRRRDAGSGMTSVRGISL